MRISALGSIQRAAYYDRNPLAVVKLADNIVAPHGNTTRWTYTVPSARKAYAETSQVLLIRQTVAAPAAEAAVNSVITPSGGSASSILTAFTFSNVVGGSDRIAIGGSIVLLAGDALSATDVDTSTGGTVEFVQTAKITEFDA